MTESERLDFVIGQVTALKAFCAALVCLHPNPKDLSRGFEKFSEITVAKSLPTGASDAMIGGMESMKADLARALQVEVAQRAHPRGS